MLYSLALSYFFFNYTTTTEIYTLSLHDALPIFRYEGGKFIGTINDQPDTIRTVKFGDKAEVDKNQISDWMYVDDGKLDRKSTRLNSSHPSISYAVFCLKKKKHHLPNLHSYQVLD